jgi:hypothetical protein
MLDEGLAVTEESDRGHESGKGFAEDGKHGVFV